MKFPEIPFIKQRDNFEILLSVFCFFLPLFPSLLPAIIAFTLLYQLFQLRSNRFKLNIRQLLFLSSLYLLYLLGLLYSENIQYATKDLETKLSLFLFPLILLLSKPLNLESRDNILKAFAYGCLISVLMNTGMSAYQLTEEKVKIANGIHTDNFGLYFFFKDRISHYIHPTYLSMYLLFALCIVFYLFEFRKKMTGKFAVTSSLLFSFFIFLLASKAGIICLFLLGAYLFGYYILQRKTFLTPVLGLLFLAIAFFSMYRLVPEFNNRINSAYHSLSYKESDNKDEESSYARRKIWHAAKEVIKENLLWGTGTGDVKDKLIEKYSELGMENEKDKRYNAHNQFLQTCITLGIPGILILMALLLPILAIAIKKKELLYVLFLLLFIINILFESMLEVQAGVLFYSFFNSLLFISMSNDQTERT